MHTLKKRKILFLFYRSPLSYNISNDKRQHFIYLTLKEHYDVKILTLGYQDSHTEEQDVVKLKKSNLKKIFNFLIKLQSPRLTHFRSEKFKNLFKETLISYKPNFIYVEHLLMMQYVLNLATIAKIIFFNDESNLYVQENYLRGNFYQKLRNVGLAKLDSLGCSKAEVVFTITKEEEKFLIEKGFNNVFTLSYTVDTDLFHFSWQKPDDNNILFVGDFSHYPNRQAIRTLINRILPGLSDLGIKLKVVGRNTNRIKNTIRDSAQVFSEVPDVRPYYYNTAVFVAPIFSGAGLRVKILEAALCGIPLVISPIANLGIDLADKEEAFICKSIVEFKEVIRNFFSSKFDDKIDRMRINARNKIITEFDETIVKDKIISVFDRIIT